MTGPDGAASPPAVAAGPVRPAALAGAWYPGSPALLLATARNLMNQAGAAPMPAGRPARPRRPARRLGLLGAGGGDGLPAPPAGVVREGRRDGPVAPRLFAGYALDDASAYRTPLGEIPLARGAVGELRPRASRASSRG